MCVGVCEGARACWVMRYMYTCIFIERGGQCRQEKGLLRRVQSGMAFMCNDIIPLIWLKHVQTKPTDKQNHRMNPWSQEMSLGHLAICPIHTCKDTHTHTGPYLLHIHTTRIHTRTHARTQTHI